MIESITITDNKRTPFKYIADLFKDGTTFTFKPGVNVIIGKNGSGKSSLINLITLYTLCEKTMNSRVPDKALLFPNIFDINGNILEGVSIRADYRGVVFHYLPYAEFKKSEIFGNFTNFSTYANGVQRSTGEKAMISLDTFFDNAFLQSDYKFPIAELKKCAHNEYWKLRIDNLIDYYKKNHINIPEEDFEYTMLMDEPDRNLDIENIQSIYDILSFHKPQTQIIATIHNPLLIYKLSKLDCVNFIELNKHYVEQVVNLIEKK